MINRAKFRRGYKAMQKKANELGFKNVFEAHNAGFTEELKTARDNADKKMKSNNPKKS